MNGLTFLLCFGRYGGFHIINGKSLFRICLGWIAFTIIYYDFEIYINELEKILEHQREARNINENEDKKKICHNCKSDKIIDLETKCLCNNCGLVWQI